MSTRCGTPVSTASALVAERATLVELPPTPVDLTPARLDSVVRRVDWVLLDTAGLDPLTDEPVWRADDVRSVLRRLDRAGFAEVERRLGVILLHRG